MERETESKVEGDGMKTDPATPEQIAAIRERCEKATPGPVFAVNVADSWMLLRSDSYTGGNYMGETFDPELCDHEDLSQVQYRRNALFMAHAREDIPLLLATLSSRDAEIERLRNALKEVRHGHGCGIYLGSECTCGLDAASGMSFQR